MEQPQVQTGEPTNQSGVQAQTPTNVADLTPFLDIQPTTEPTTAPQVQAQVQTEPQVAPEGVSELQRKLNERQIALYQAEQRANQLQEQMLRLMQTQQPQAQDPMPDPNQDYAAYTRWVARQEVASVTKTIQESSRQEMQNMLAQLAETAWVSQHPNVDIGAVKAFNRQNGIAEWNLDAGMKLMNYNNTIQGAASAGVQQTINSFRQTQPTASPLRGSAPTGSVQPQLSFEKLAQAVNKNPDILDTLPKQVRDDFERELWARQQMQ